jgi:hypothetical protein
MVAVKSATSPLTGDALDLRPVQLSAAEATELRRNASRHGRQVPISQYERDLYAAEALQPPTI